MAMLRLTRALGVEEAPRVSVPTAALAAGVGGVLLLGAALASRKRRPTEDTGAGVPEEKIAKQGFSEKVVPKDLDMIVIGSGMGGLTIAALMAKEGKKVLVLEQHDQAGGNLHTFEEKGFEFDTGLHYIGGQLAEKRAPFRKLLDYVTDNGVEWVPLDDNYDTAVLRDGATYERYPMHKDIKKLRQSFMDWCPEDKAAIDEYFRLVRKVRISAALRFTSRLLPPWLWRCIAPFAASWLRLYRETTESRLSSLTSNRKLIGLLTYLWGDYGTPPSCSAFAVQAAIQEHWRGGGFYPVGGPAVIPRCMIRVIERAGGKVLVRAPVTRLLMDSNGAAVGVCVKGKTSVFAKTIVSSIGAPLTYTRLVPEDHHHRIRDELAGVMQDKITPGSISLASVFVGIHGDADELKLPKGNIWVLPSWDHDANVERFRNDPEGPLPALFMSFSSAKDPTYATRHPGKQVGLVIGPALYEQFEEFKDQRVKHRGAKYEAMKQKMQERYVDALVKEFPQLKDRIEFVDTGTPVTNDFYLGNYRGACYGLQHTTERFDAPWLRPTTPIPGLYLTGQDVMCCGVAGAAFGGLLTAGVISRSFLACTAWKILLPC